MKVRVSLSADATNYLLQYGDTLSEAVDNVLSAIIDSGGTLSDKPSFESSSDEVQRYVDVTNVDYLTLYSIYSSKSSRVSLRRVLYWFIGNDMGTKLVADGVLTVKHPMNAKRDSAWLAQTRAIEREMLSLKNTMMCYDDVSDELKRVATITYENVKTLREMFENE